MGPLWLLMPSYGFSRNSLRPFLERRVYKGPPEDLGFQGHPGEGFLMASSRFFRSLGLWRGTPGKKLLPLYRGFCPQGPLGP